VARSQVDAILVGDSAAMVVHGHDTTLPATLSLMAMHTRAVARAAGGKFVIADLPFLSYRKGIPAAMTAVGLLVRNGAHAVKLEGVEGHGDVIRQIVGSGVPVMGHLGLTPQSVHRFGGFRVQGRSDAAAAALVEQAHQLEDLGCFAVVLECVPAVLGARLTAELTIPTIGSAPERRQTGRCWSSRICGASTRAPHLDSFAATSTAKRCSPTRSMPTTQT
jgi:3-methyl-2-oxobutanoate hydroxymethyltransferase